MFDPVSKARGIDSHVALLKHGTAMMHELLKLLVFAVNQKMI